MTCDITGVIAESGNGTQWHMGDEPIGPDEPDPNEDDANKFNLWDEWERD